MKKFFRLCSLALLLSLTGRLPAAEPAAPAQPVYPAAAYETAYQLLDVLKTREMLDDSLAAMLKMQLEHSNANAAQRQIFENFFRKYLSFDLLKQGFADIYLAEFTVPELQELIAFYQTPLGQKLAARQALLSRQSAALGQAQIQAHLPELQQQLAAAAEEQ
ncbi:DUF2059 domain-containing protein [Victivallis sp. Marseille-Q1083]|uniref:DUF2059 domain-containing protein n=1 Tax=Victivallis sp. Marseille-Q1083 TaxID=2717288 RepID=UPI00158A7DF3|nr:DUF2059 domain-containing protein [Victivallis sp. Marseille-Q1083]